MILSKVMRPGDMLELWEELVVVDAIAARLGGWDPVQHPARRWEYAMAWKALQQWGSIPGVSIADFGCGIGLLGPMLYAHGYQVSAYEPWVYGDETSKAVGMISRIGKTVGSWKIINRPLCELTDEDRNFDAAFCISTLEHIGEYERAFRDMCKSVRSGGLIFLTTDFAEHEKDDYQLAYLRAGRMFCPDVYHTLMTIGVNEGCTLLDHPTEDPLSGSDYVWSEECRMVNNYGFASLAMVKA